MKIIKLGKVKGNQIVETCHKCDTKFSYTKDDVKRDTRDGDYVNCPHCNAFITSKIN